jgi:phytoene dehydrogenase-like protein
MDDPGLELPSSVQVAVVGAGLAGLVCARALARAGRDVHLFEAGSAIGGRMRTERHRDGFLLDHGFHVFLTGYPSVAREIDVARLDLHPFRPGCVVAKNGRLYPLSETMEAARFPFATWRDGLRMRGLRSADPSRTPDRSTMEYLRSLGLSSKIIESFFVPFFGGVFLDRTLSNSARYFASIMKAFLAGPVGIPGTGIGAVPEQVAEGIPDGSIHLDGTIDSLRIEDGRVRGLVVAGQEVRADRVVLACGVPDAARLGGLELPPQELRGMTVVYFATKTPPTEERRLFIRGDAEGWTNHFAVLSNVAPGLAPEGQHLLMGAVLGTHELNEGAIAERVRSEMAWWFPHAMTHTWQWLRTFKLPAAQWALPPGLADRLPGVRTPIEGLLLAGDFTREPSVEGAIRSGLDAAQALLAG